MKAGRSRTMLAVVVAATSMLIFSACGDDGNSADDIGNLICADGTRASGANCDGTSDCSDGSDEIACDPDCVAALPVSSLCDGVDDCDAGADEQNCAIDDDCDDDFDDSQVCDGANDCPGGSDELGCNSDLSANVFKNRIVYAGAPVTLIVGGVDDLSKVVVRYDGLRLDTVTRDGFLTFRMPPAASGSTAILVSTEEDRDFRIVRLQLNVQSIPDLLDANEAITQFKSDFDLILPATEDTSSTARNFSLPPELLDANEAVATTVTEDLPLLSSEEVVTIARQVNVTNLLMGAEAPSPTQPAIRKNHDSEECLAIRDEVVDYTERVRSGVNLIASNIRANATNAELSVEAKRVAESLAYGYWTYLLRGALEAYDDYVDNCSTVQWEFVEPTTATAFTTFMSGVSYVPDYYRNLTLETEIVIEAMEGCELALDDVVAELQDVLGISSDIDFSAISETEWRDQVAPSDLEFSLPNDSPAEVIYDSVEGSLQITWLELVNDDQDFELGLIVKDAAVTGETVTPVSVSVQASTLFCSAPGTNAPENGNYLVSLSGDGLGSQLLFQLSASPGDGTDDVLLDLYPLVRDACSDGTAPGCSVNALPRDFTGEPAGTVYLLSEVTDPLVVSFNGIYIDQQAYLPAGGQGTTYNLSLSLSACQTDSFCGSGSLDPANGDGPSLAVEFAAEGTTDITSIPVPASTCSEL